MMTKPSIALSELLEKGQDSDLLWQMIQHIVQRVMDMVVENLCAASYGERSPERQNSRKRLPGWPWETRARAFNVKILRRSLVDSGTHALLAAQVAI